MSYARLDSTAVLHPLSGQRLFPSMEEIGLASFEGGSVFASRVKADWNTIITFWIFPLRPFIIFHFLLINDVIFKFPSKVI